MEIDFSALRLLRFSKLAITCYGSLYLEGSASIKQLSARLQCSQWSIYKCLKPLIKYGFISKAPKGDGPQLLFAVMVDEALANYYQYLTIELGQAINAQRAHQRELRLSS